MSEEKNLNVCGVDYIVSSDGHIFSTKNCGRGKYHKEISQRENSDGYMQVTVGDNKHRKSKKVHRIVAEAFIPNPNNYPEIDHIDYNRKNNNINNLRWIDSYSNKARTPFNVRSESHKYELNGRAKLTKEDVKQIRILYKNGMCKNDIAKKYGRGWSTIHNIIEENTWKSI